MSMKTFELTVHRFTDIVAGFRCMDLKTGPCNGTDVFYS